MRGKRSLLALTFGAVPWIAYAVISPFLNYPKPLVAGMTPMMFWDIIIWLPLTTLCLWIAYRLEFNSWW